MQNHNWLANMLNKRTQIQKTTFHSLLFHVLEVPEKTKL